MKKSQLEYQFEFIWEAVYPEIELWAEQKLVPGRRFRFDFCHYPSKTAIEVNGGNWIFGRHTRPNALNREYEKILLVAMEGWLTLFLSQDQLTEEYIKKIGAVIETRRKES